MYIVVSRWEALPGKSDEFEAVGKKMRSTLGAISGVSLMEAFQSENGTIMVVVGYDSLQDYDRLVNDPNGPFAKAAEENQLDSVGRWISSDRGEAIHP